VKLLFLDQTAELGGAELSLFSEVTNLPHVSLVLLFEDGAFREMLALAGVNVAVIPASPGAMTVRREAGMLTVFFALPAVLRLVLTVAKRAKAYDIIYANSQKAFVVGIFAAVLARRPLVWRLRDVLSADHFSATLRRIVVLLANWKAARVIANSVATGKAFAAVGGNVAKVSVAYPGIDEAPFSSTSASAIATIRAEINAGNAPLIGVFGRLSLWKGQAVFIDAIARLPGAIGVIVGGPLFGHEEFAAELTEKVVALGLESRIRFLGFRADIPALMSAMDIIVHSSIAPEPFGRVVVEGMLAGKPVVASAAGGVLEILEHGKTGWLYEPSNPDALANVLQAVLDDQVLASTIAKAGQLHARQTFTVAATVKQIEAALLKC
jgi:glycosyltransferase involved in cell wall biosynthesis